MAERLKSVFKINQLRLILKTLIFAGLLFLAKISGFGILPVLLFFVLNLAMYYRGQERREAGAVYSFAILLFVALFGAGSLNHFQFLLPAILFFSFIFYIAMGIRSLAFVNRNEWNYAKNILLAYSVFLVYFLSNKYDWFFAKYLFVFAAIFLLAGEWFSWLENNFPKRYRLAAVALAFLTLQLLWAVSVLPLGFLNSATIMLVFFYLMFDFCEHHFRGTINRRLLLKNSVLLFVSVFIIFIFTNWKV